MKKNYLVIVFVLLVLLSTFVSAFVLDEESEKIYRSETLTIEQKVTGGITMNNPVNDLSYLYADYNFFPINTYRQTVLSEEFSPEYSSKDADLVIFELEDVPSSVDITSIYTIETKNRYKQIKEVVAFPVDKNELPAEVLDYLLETDMIDMTDDIKTTASLVASGKNDLFEATQSVASWVVNNVEYDLTTLTQEYSQKASWVFRTREGVCDELSILFVAMMRSLGVPARISYGISYSNSELFTTPWMPHAWTEVYFPKYGWVPFDLTYRQFGFIDASHIKFRDSLDVGKISANYKWKGYNIDDLGVAIKDTEFDMTVKSATGKVDDAVDIDVSVLYEVVKMGSYNLLKINMKNNKNYYVSNLLHLVAPGEIAFDGEGKLTTYLKPNEEKAFYVLMSIDSDLSSNFAYTMPVSVITAFGERYDMSFKVASNYEYVSLNQVNSYMRLNTKDESDDSLTYECSFGDEFIYSGHKSSFVCQIFNSGNTFLEGGEVCAKSEVLNLDECFDVDITIGGTETLTWEISTNKKGSTEIGLTIDFDAVKQESVYSAFVNDLPKVDLEKLVVTDNFEPGDAIEIVAGVNKTSISVPKNFEIRVLVNNNKFVWKFTSLNQSTDFNIPLNSYLLRSGENTVVADIKWEDETGGQYFADSEIIINVDNFGIIDKAKSWWYRLVN